jgi:hypothetical protein
MIHGVDSFVALVGCKQAVVDGWFLMKLFIERCANELENGGSRHNEGD